MSVWVIAPQRNISVHPRHLCSIDWLLKEKTSNIFQEERQVLFQKCTTITHSLILALVAICNPAVRAVRHTFSALSMYHHLQRDAFWTLCSQHFKVMQTDNRETVTEAAAGYILHIWWLQHHNMENLKRTLHLSKLFLLSYASWIFQGHLENMFSPSITFLNNLKKVSLICTFSMSNEGHDSVIRWSNPWVSKTLSLSASALLYDTIMVLYGGQASNWTI